LNNKIWTANLTKNFTFYSFKNIGCTLRNFNEDYPCDSPEAVLGKLQDSSLTSSRDAVPYLLAHLEQLSKQW
jgi:hypothetical protein